MVIIVIIIIIIINDQTKDGPKGVDDQCREKLSFSFVEKCDLETHGCNILEWKCSGGVGDNMDRFEGRFGT